MAYYVLNKGFELCGWMGLPFGLRYPNPHYADFFDEEDYHVVYALDGKHDIKEEELTEKQKKLLNHLIDIGIAIPGDGTRELEPWQEYKYYPAMYKSSVQWSVTGRCNYRCRHCFMSAPDYKGRDMTPEEAVHILDELVSCGIRSVALTGGEPLVYPHFYELLDEIKKRNIHLDTIYSNSELVDEKLLDELEKRDMNPAFHMSFDGIGWHDWLRGVEGAEETVIRKFKLLHERGCSTSTSMCLHRHNIHDLKKNIDLLASLGLVHVKMNVASPTGRWKNETEHFCTQDEANQAVLEYFPQYIADGMPISVQFCGMINVDKEHKRLSIPFARFTGLSGSEERYACGAVKTGMYISPAGKVLPCMTLGGTAIDPEFDSIHEKTLREILSGSYYRDCCFVKMGDCIDHNELCRDCKWRLACGAGCRSWACGETGTDYLGIDQEACRFFCNGWYDKTVKLLNQYKDCFQDMTKENDQREQCDI